jgi:hypothetical protein
MIPAGRNAVYPEYGGCALDNSPAGGPSGFTLHTLIPIEDFKVILGIDDREDCLDFASVQNPGHEFLYGKNSANSFQPPSLAAFCLITATYTIEQYCKRRLLRKKRFEFLPFYGDYIFPLRDYPVREVVTISKEQVTSNSEQVTSNKEQVTRSKGGRGRSNEQLGMSNGEVIGAEFYRVIPDLEGEAGAGPEDTVYSLYLSPALRLMRGVSVLKVCYWAGYEAGEVPPDLASACLELAAWNMSRYRGPPPRSGFLIGMTGNVRGNGKEGEHLEISMPENVRLLLEPYKRRMI